MNSRHSPADSKVMSAARALVLLLPAVGFALLVSSCASVRAPESPTRPTVSIKWRETFRITENHFLAIDGLPGRTIGVMEQRGLAFFENDQVATLTLWSTCETTGTNTAYRGYAQYVFEDDSRIVALLERTGAVPGKQKGTLTFLRGSGRFLGIQGDATFTSNVITSRDAGGDTYIDAGGKYSLLQTVSQPGR